MIYFNNSLNYLQQELRLRFKSIFAIGALMSKLIGQELDERAFAQINARESTVVVATTSPNGYPNTTPIHLIIAPKKHTLLLAMNRDHQGLKNIRSDPKIMISLCEKDDLNISARCDARVLKERMDCNEHMCVVRADIVDIKDDSTHSFTISGIRYRCKTEKGEAFIRGVFDELAHIASGLEK